MKKKFAHIILTVLSGFILVALTVASASAQKEISPGVIEVNQCETIEFSVVEWPGDRYTWDIYRDSMAAVNFAVTDGDVAPALYFENGMYQGSTVKVKWLDPGRYFVRIMVWDESRCTNNLKLIIVNVIATAPELELVADSVCIGEPTSVRIIFTGIGPYTLDYTYGDAITGNVVNVNGYIVDGPEATIPITQPLPVGETKFWVINIDDGCKAYEYSGDERPGTGILIYPKPARQPIYLKEQ